MTKIMPEAFFVMPKEAFVTTACEKVFVDFLYSKLGLVIRKHQLNGLHNAIYEGCRYFGHGNWQDYFAALKYGNNVSPEMEQLIAAVTIGESYFFRDQNQIAWLRDTWLPQMIDQRRKQGDLSLRIWSAGCSSGQELYTLAILLAEALPDLDAWNIHLMGTDINADVLSNALRGHYSSWSFRATPDAVRDRYFNSQNNGFTINDHLRHMACFTYLNLADDEYPSMLTQTNSMDLILCRNVFIYFDKAVVDRVMQRFSRCLLPGGVLMLGASDLIASGIDSLRLIQHENIFYYHNSSPQSYDSGSINNYDAVSVSQDKPNAARQRTVQLRLKNHRCRYLRQMRSMRYCMMVAGLKRSISSK
ncbi:MAG: chemotaxis protein CheR [Zetaproteobacteria bacterium CG12_big_fil_rev_8_21_14_0_65_54_13]|nr:MAG: chemotaxis protein CheR [Zetaproteobacteria bacterium CG12_big_fil_rev_8_21_14_0_65_54_13]PIX55710.1 MAG: chemotaxis protein CheR [Zetaproteobacteria bacterium CG_4_10_14_3_um_filter_54_28]PJA28179.1 MAG: chemotaxis protein CheR [Zetaproteobacteria bacterium CG_4_9_14_3_um_filter_54_145]